MKSLIMALGLSTSLIAPGLALARPVTLTANLTQYGGRGAYMAIYVTDASGAYAGSVWMAGQKAKYYRHLVDWSRFTNGDASQVDGITGASVGTGQSLVLTMDLADSLFDAGYTLHIDAAAEDMRESPNEIAVPLTAAGAGQATQGRRYIADFSYAF